jgi:hypothetical protein
MASEGLATALAACNCGRTDEAKAAMMIAIAKSKKKA